MLLLIYNYFAEIYYTCVWVGLSLLLAYIGLRLTGRDLSFIPPAIIVYLFIFCWAKATFMEAYGAKDIVGYRASTRSTGGWISEDVTEYSCQEPIYAHESRGHFILWLGPFVAAAFALFYDIARKTRHSIYLTLLFVPFVFGSYLFFGFYYLFDSDLKPCANSANSPAIIYYDNSLFTNSVS